MQLPVNIIQILTYNVLNSPFKWSLSVWPVDKYDRHRKYFSCDWCSRRCIVMYQKNFFFNGHLRKVLKATWLDNRIYVIRQQIFTNFTLMYLSEFEKKNFHIAVPNSLTPNNLFAP